MRKTYFLSDILEWKLMEETNDNRLKREIREAIEQGCAGMKMDVEDVEEWEKILRLED